jgi:hypothetical protein
MKHLNPDELLSTAELFPSLETAPKLTPAQRMDRWAKVLDEYDGPICALRRLEYLRGDQLREYRGTNTPLTVAFNDPILRADGLRGDSLGEAMDFFALSDQDAHHLLCDCHYHGTMTASGLASRIRQQMRRQERWEGWTRVARRVFGWAR